MENPEISPQLYGQTAEYLKKTTSRKPMRYR